MSKKPESFGDSFFGVVMVVVVLMFLFLGEPDVFDLAQAKSIEYLSE